MDPHWLGFLDPDPRWDKMLDPDPHGYRFWYSQHRPEGPVPVIDVYFGYVLDIHQWQGPGGL
jgi:hypothetical protein